METINEEQPEQESELIRAIYAGAKALKEKDSDDHAKILRELSRLLNDAQINDLETLEEITKS